MTGTLTFSTLSASTLTWDLSLHLDVGYVRLLGILGSHARVRPTERRVLQGSPSREAKSLVLVQEPIE